MHMYVYKLQATRARCESLHRLSTPALNSDHRGSSVSCCKLEVFLLICICKTQWQKIHCLSKPNSFDNHSVCAKQQSIAT